MKLPLLTVPELVARALDLGWEPDPDFDQSKLAQDVAAFLVENADDDDHIQASVEALVPHLLLELL